MLRKSDIIQRRDAARKQFMEDEDYNKWTETLDQLYGEAVPNDVYFDDTQKNINDALTDGRF